MPAALSPVPVLSSASLRFGVWRPLLKFVQGSPAHAQPGLSPWRAEWNFHRQSLLTQRQLWSGLALLGMLLCMLGWSWGFDQLGAALLVQIPLGLAAVFMYARRAGDGEMIAMHASLVRVRRRIAGREQCIEFHPRWVRVEPDRDDHSLVRLSGQGRSVVVGEFVRKQHRRQLADEFRWALKHIND